MLKCWVKPHLVTLPKAAIDEDRVDGVTVSLDDLHLEDSALQLLDEHETIHHHALTKADKEPQEVADALTSDGGRRHNVDKAAGVPILPVELHIQPL
jgi:hypothetical protein